jgi:hypothetical protein
MTELRLRATDVRDGKHWRLVQITPRDPRLAEGRLHPEAELVGDDGCCYRLMDVTLEPEQYDGRSCPLWP